MRVCFIGHRRLISNIDIYNRLYTTIKKEIENGYNHFTMGTHGQFDALSLNVCRDLRKKYKDIEIEVVFTSLYKLKKDDFNHSIIDHYSDVKTCIYDIENVYFKNIITYSNQQMIDSCDMLICYVNPNVLGSGAKKTMNYAKRKGLKIINLFDENDIIKINYCFS